MHQITNSTRRDDYVQGERAEGWKNRTGKMFALGLPITLLQPLASSSALRRLRISRNERLRARVTQKELLCDACHDFERENVHVLHLVSTILHSIPVGLRNAGSLRPLIRPRHVHAAVDRRSRIADHESPTQDTVAPL